MSRRGVECRCSSPLSSDCSREGCKPAGLLAQPFQAGVSYRYGANDVASGILSSNSG